MKYLRQFLIIMSFSLVGEVLQRVIPIPIPASVYGIILLFTALCLGIVKVEQIQTVGSFLTSMLPVLFVPPVVGILENWDVIRDAVLVIFLLSLISAFLTFAVSGWVAQLLAGRKEAEHD